MNPKTWLFALPSGVRIALIVLIAVLAHYLVQGLRRASEWILAPARMPGLAKRELVARSHPKIATVTSLVVSALTFTIYFVAFGLVLKEFNVSLTAYLATASVLGLAIAFGSQGLVQDVVIGLTLVFSDAFDIGDMIEVSGQIGRVEQVGLRFTTIVNLHGQRVYVPNRTIGLVGRYRRGVIRAYVDIQIPQGFNEKEVSDQVERLARGLRTQHRAIVVADPEVVGIYDADPGGWRYLRVMFRLWPGQGSLIETNFRQRVLAAMREYDPGYPDWMVAVTYRIASEPPRSPGGGGSAPS